MKPGVPADDDLERSGAVGPSRGTGEWAAKAMGECPKVEGSA
jgi:hypothetical protein